MKKSHREILDKIENYLEQPGSEHLRFWQALRGCNVVVYEEMYDPDSEYHTVIDYAPVNDYNISDERLLKRII